MGSSIRVLSPSLIGRRFLTEFFPLMVSVLVLICATTWSYYLTFREKTTANINNAEERVIASVGPENDWGPLTQYKPLIKESSARYGIEAALVRAVMMHESKGDPHLVSRAGALGLMQCTPDKFGPGENPFDPRTNIEKGTKYLARMLDKFGSVPLAVAAYNAGPGAVRKYGGIPPYPETQAYVPRVVDTYKRYCQ